MAQYQTIYRQDYQIPKCNAEYTEFRDYIHVQPCPWDTLEMKPGIEPKVHKDRPKRFPVHVEPIAKCPMCHPCIRKFDRYVSSGYCEIEKEPCDFKFELGQKRKILLKWPRTEYKDTINKFGIKVMKGKVKKDLARKWFGRKATKFVF